MRKWFGGKEFWVLNWALMFTSFVIMTLCQIKETGYANILRSQLAACRAEQAGIIAADKDMKQTDAILKDADDKLKRSDEKLKTACDGLAVANQRLMRATDRWVGR